MSGTETNVCSECPGRCCTRSRWIFGEVELTMRESEHPALKDHVVWSQNPADPKRQLPRLNLDPKCPLLGKDNRCTVYEDRPEACRNYICYWNPPPNMEERFPTHFKMLRKWKVLPGQEFGMTKEELEESDRLNKWERSAPPKPK